jgi:hypothetical protein
MTDIFGKTTGIKRPINGFGQIMVYLHRLLDTFGLLLAAPLWGL